MIGKVKIRKNKAPIETRPAVKKIPLNIFVKRYTTDGTGQILATPAIPASMQGAFAFHAFGEFDRQGGFQIADKVTNVNGSILFSTYVYGLNTPLFFFSPLANINAQFKKGDIIHVYVDNINAPNYFTFVVISTTSGGYASLVSQSNITQIDDNGPWGVFKCDEIKFTWYNDEQLNYPLVTIQSYYNGNYKSDSFDPSSYYSTMQKPDLKTVYIPVKMLVNQYAGLSGYIPLENSVLNLEFILYK